MGASRHHKKLIQISVESKSFLECEKLLPHRLTLRVMRRSKRAEVLLVCLVLAIWCLISSVDGVGEPSSSEPQRETQKCQGLQLC
jgi:hypothetical protein